MKIKYFSAPFLARLNRSHERYRELAQSKFLGNALAVFGIYALVFLSVPATFWRLVWLASFFVVFPKMVGRYLVSWYGTIPRQPYFGFFVCCGCRRLKPSSHMSCRRYGKEGSIVCDDCNPNFAEAYTSLSELQKSSGDLFARIDEAKKKSLEKNQPQPNA